MHLAKKHGHERESPRKRGSLDVRQNDHNMAPSICVLPIVATERSERDKAREGHSIRVSLREASSRPQPPSRYDLPVDAAQWQEQFSDGPAKFAKSRQRWRSDDTEQSCRKHVIYPHRDLADLRQHLRKLHRKEPATASEGAIQTKRFIFAFSHLPIRIYCCGIER